MAEWTVIVKRPDGGIGFDTFEADSVEMQPDLYSSGRSARYYVLKDSDGAEVARFNARDIVGVRKGRHVPFDVDIRFPDDDTPGP